MDKVYDRFNPDAKYKEIKFRAGFGLQSTELNEIQSTVMHEFKTVTNTLYNDGSILAGGETNVSGNQFSISSSIVYANGFTHNISNSAITIPQSGTSIVGLELKKIEITELEDPDLRDPAVGTRNYNEAGAGRIRYDASWKLEQDADITAYFYPMYSFINGVLQSSAKIAPELESTKNMLARYDNASSGSYVVDGLELSFEYNDTTTSEHVFSISSGTGHSEGYEVEFQYAQKLRIPYNINKNNVTAEPHTFTADGDYSLRHAPLAVVTQIIGVKRVTQTITHGTYNGAKDTLPNTPVVSLISVTQGATTYIAGVDFTLNGDQIDWTLAGAEPSPSSTYTVIYQYTTSTVTNLISTDLTKLNVTGLDAGTLFYVTYSYYVPRIDRVLLLKDGTFKILTGVPDSANPVAPTYSVGLSLGTIYMVFGSTPLVTLDYYKAFKMSDIQKMFNSITDIKYNVARLSLIDDVRSIDPSSVKKNLFVDPFFDDDLRDQGLTQNALIDDQILSANSTWVINSIYTGQNLIIDNTGVIVLANTSMTKDRKINEYAWLDAEPANMKISPASYQWVETITYRTIVGNGSSYSTDSVSNVTAIIPQIPIVINATLFNANETVAVYFDERFVQNLTANAQGILSGTITVPANTPSGSKFIKIVGAVSGVVGGAVFIATPMSRTFTTVVAPVNLDPIAQTMTFDENMFVKSVDLRFTVLPLKWVSISLCETSVGIPNKQKTLGVVRKFTNEITLNNWTNFEFDVPFYVSSGVEYAIVVETTDAVASVATSEIGKYDTINFRWVTSQSYSVGVLLNSSNSSTWTAIQKEDLTFRLSRSNFQPVKNSVLGTVTVTDKTDLILLANTEIYPDTSVKFKGILENRNNEEIILSPFNATSFSSYTGNIRVELTMNTSDPMVSPLTMGSIQLASGLIEFPASYISRTFAVNGTSLSVYLEIYQPSASTIKVFYFNGVSHVEMTRNVSKAVMLNSEYVDMAFEVSGLAIASTNIKIVLDTSDNTQRPTAKNLRAFVV